MYFIIKISILCLINLISMVLSAPTTTVQVTSDIFENVSTSTKQTFSSPEVLSFLPITSSTSSPVLISTTTIQPSIAKSTDPIASASISTTTIVTSIPVTSSTKAVENVNVLSLFAINNNNYNPENEIINDDDDDYLQYYYLYYL